MTVIVVGLGSMGKRRIRLLGKIDNSIQIIGVDSNSERADSVSKELEIITALSIKEAVEKYNPSAGIVCTSPLSHQSIIEELLEYNLHVFTEINLVDNGYHLLIERANAKHLNLFLSSTFLYRKDIQYIIERTAQTGKPVSYLYHTGQYLPDWHPWESYKNFFVADKRTNGCREILTIELPWIIKCFGKIKKIHVIRTNTTNLDLNYEDTYMIQIEHVDGNVGLLAVDVASRVARRSLELYNEDLQIFWDGRPDSLKEYNVDNNTIEKVETYDSVDKDNRYAANIIENAYEDELYAFINWIKNNDGSGVRYTFEDDIDTLKWIDEIEK